MKKATFHGGPVTSSGRAIEYRLPVAPLKFFAHSSPGGIFYGGASHPQSDYAADHLHKLQESLERIEERLDRMKVRSDEPELTMSEYSSEEIALVRRFFDDANDTEANYAYEHGQLQLADVMAMALESLENASAVAAEAAFEAVSMRRVIDRNSRLIDTQQAALTKAIKKLSTLEDV